MAKVQDLPPAVWFGVAGAALFAGAGALPERVRLFARVAGLAGVSVGLALGFREILELFNVIEPPRIDSIEDQPIADPRAGSSFDIHGDQGGLVGASIRSPADGSKVDRELLGDTYKVEIELASSKRVATSARVTLISDEYYGFGGTEKRVTDLGRVDVPPESKRTVFANIDIASSGFFNPFAPPEVALTLLLDGNPVDVARFVYS